ncbi:MAG: WecB/TagA/CpsF family glycosyltransferase [Pirellulaceae bacterium]|jgi:N-acetylglucosaminyldiphosphoundecaprenol N-acetyl-beta-D-mannosaminyltransferase|nr:WecB/TagA/CpsF family glycosyltransferase [Pirellulaceae bacterium]
MDATAQKRVSMFGVDIDALTFQETVRLVSQWAFDPWEQCRYVVTPNVDHAVMLQHDVHLQRAYKSAHLVVADGRPILWASKLLGRPIPQLVSGSDLTPALFKYWDRPRKLSVFLLGAMPGVAEVAAERIECRWPHVSVVDTLSPPLGFEYDENECGRIIQRVNAASPDVLVVGLGAPKQEIWTYRHRSQLRAKVALCVGATIDFLAGEKGRAPHWMRRIGMEWFHRVCSEPKRLAKRYARDGFIFPQLVWEEMFVE